MHLMLIGGGEIGGVKKDGTIMPVETVEIDRQFISWTGVSNPKLLFLPTATEPIDPDHLYEQAAREHFGNRLGCIVDTLYLLDPPSETQIKERLNEADCIYIGGGRTSSLLNTWRKCGFDRLLIETVKQGKPVSGVSAGAINLFQKAISKQGDIFLLLDGLGVLPGGCAPHYHHPKRREETRKVIAAHPDISFLAIDDFVGVEIQDDAAQLWRAQKTSNAYHVKGEKETQLPDFFSLSDLNNM